MGSLRVVALGVALVALAVPAAARELSESDQRFVAITTMAPIFAGMCGSHVVPSSFIRIGDSLGVDDAEALFKATLAAMDILGHREYRREDLMPAVTRFVAGITEVVASEFSTNKQDACKRYLARLREAGAVE